LPHLLSRPRYRHFFRKVEGLKILDNGTAESRLAHADLLFDLAQYVGADEIVVPDTMMDMATTILQAERFRSHITPQRVRSYRFMGVLQGESMDEIMHCADAFVELDYISTFGIPRCYANKYGPDSRSAIYYHLYEEYGELYDYHFLGCSKHIDELELLGVLCRGARSIDSSLPFVLAMEGLNFQDGEYVDRQPGYFDRQFSAEQRHRARINCERFIKSVGRTETSGGAL
jgi:hypothetical protein